MNTSEVQFNIIFTPYTANYLSPFIFTLLEWTDCRYRIISNGCTEADKRLLESICASDDRLEYFLLSENGMLPHGAALNILQKDTNSEWFCFMDSDILATGPYMETIAGYMRDYDVFSSGHPLWHSPADIVLPDSYRRLHGIHFGTSDGKVLGGTYFAVFNNRVLTEALERTGVDFNIYRWEQVSAAHRTTLQQAGLAKLEYDTGMLLMSLMYADGVKFAVEDLPNICHLGGFSSRAEDEPAYYYRGKADRIAVNSVGGLLARPLLWLADSWYAATRPSPGFSAEQSRTLPFTERRLIEGRIRKRRNTARYFKALMQGLIEGTEEPPLTVLGYPAAETRIEAAAKHVAAAYSQYLGRCVVE
jgi:hypothetical protein